MTFSVTKNGKPLPKYKYIWDNKTKTFSTNEDDLVLDFSDYHGVTFKTGSYCTFRAGTSCTFKTGNYCIFDVYENCEFLVGKECAIIRRGVFEMFCPKPNKKIKLREHFMKGFYTEEELMIKDIIE